MSDETARVRLKIGQLEIEYEGRAPFLQDGLIDLMKKVIGVYADHKQSIPADSPTTQQTATGSSQLSGGIDHSTNTIAAHLNATSGPELVIAAAAHLAMVRNKDRFTRQEIIDEMKDATTYYKATMLGNLTKYFNSLVKTKRLNQLSKGVFALSASELKGLESKLAH